MAETPQPAPVELAWLGPDCQRVGVVVPPSNPVAEPELDALVGDDILIYSARLPRYAGLPLEERNRLYVPAYRDALDSLIGLGLSCAVVAMTGPNYRLGLDGDRELCAELTAGFGAPVRTASLAIYEALTDRGITRVHLLSPYPDWLTDETADYWEEAGIGIASVQHLLGHGEEFRAYETRTYEVVTHLKAMRPDPGSAVLVTGTGLVSIAGIYQMGVGYEVPILSGNLCAAWWILRQCGYAAGSRLYQGIACGTEPS